MSSDKHLYSTGCFIKESYRTPLWMAVTPFKTLLNKFVDDGPFIIYLKLS